MIIIPKEQVKEVTWEQDPDTFDLRLHDLGLDYADTDDEFLVINPMYDEWFVNEYIDIDQHDHGCVVWAKNDIWIAKKFKQSWRPSEGWHVVQLDFEFQRTTKYNPAIPENIRPRLDHDIAFYNLEHTWYLAPQFNPTEDKIWVAKTSVVNADIVGTKDMGSWAPEIEYNPDLTGLDLSVDEIIPYYELVYDLVWYLDPKFNPVQEKVWAARITSKYSQGEKDMGYIMPKVNYEPVTIEFNSEIPDVEMTYKDGTAFTFDRPYNEINYELVWYLDPKFNPTKDMIWVARVRPAFDNPAGTKDMGYLTPKVTYNPDVPKLDYELHHEISYVDLCYEHVWMLPSDIHSDEQKIWAAKITPRTASQGVKVVGDAAVKFNPFDVVFISYGEPNAEANWHRVLEKAPKARRVNMVKGIFEAHKAAAKLVATDMFYVVDGDAELLDSWKFNFQPNVFDRDCVHLWRSRNPVNDLEYGWGGVKLFPRQLLLDAETWNLDMTTELGKLKIVNAVANLTSFNTDPFSTWRSAFRESVKLAVALEKEFEPEAAERLEIWTTVGADRLNGEYAIHGAKMGAEYGRANADNPEQLKLINNYEWMKNEFDKFNR